MRLTRFTRSRPALPVRADIARRGFFVREIALNVSELADKLATDHGLPKAKAKSLIEATFTAVAEAVASGQEVSIQGFGRFKAADRPARQGRNPATDSRTQDPAADTGNVRLSRVPS